MNFTWHEAKRKTNLKKHGLDFADAEQVFSGPTVTIDDDRLYDGEQRFNTTGLLGVQVVVITLPRRKAKSESSPCARLNNMKSKTSSPTSKRHARLRVGLKDVDCATFAAAVSERLGKQRVSIMLDSAIIEFFKAKAGERGYQTMINQALRQAMHAEQLEATLRRIIREELHAA